MENSCCKSPCPFTMGYYIGGGLYMCWAHIMQIPGLLDAIIEREQDPEGLVPSCTFEEALRRFRDNSTIVLATDLQDRIDERVHRLQRGHNVGKSSN